MCEELKLANWRDVSFTSGRVATEQDVKDGKAVFYIPTGSEPYETELPLFGVHIDSENKTRVPCVVIQIEKSPEGALVGVRYFSGGDGVGMASEFEFYNDIPDEFNS